MRRMARLVGEFVGAPPSAPPWGHLLAVGDVYRRGAFPRYRPDPAMAERLYATAARCPDGEVAGLGQARFIEARVEPLAEEDAAGAALPRGPGEELHAAASRALAATPYSAYGKPGVPKRRAAAPREPLNALSTLFLGDDDDADADATDDMLLAALASGAAAAEPPPARRRPPPGHDAYKVDPQNVHDHGVSAVTGRNLRRLVQEEERRRDGDAATLQDLQALVESHPALDAATVRGALATLHGLSPEPHSVHGLSEREAAGLVLRRVLALGDAPLQANLVETLGRQLAEARDVCSTGKIARLVSVLDGVEDGAGAPVLEAARPMWAVREELASLAAKVRDADPDAPPEALRARFEQQARELYVGQLGMSGEVVGPLVELYSEGF